jgi:hypothetical protein
MLQLIGPAVAIIGLVAVVFVMRHKSVEKRSMYSARRSQIEHKVRAARQRTLIAGKQAEKASAEPATSPAAAAPSAGAAQYSPPASVEAPAAAPPAQSAPPPAEPAWETGPTTPVPSPPAYTPPAPAYETPAYEPAARATPADEPAWTPTAPEPPPAMPAATPAGGGASWSIVGETKGDPEPAPSSKKKKSKEDAQRGAWSLASGEVAGDEPDEAPGKPSAAVAIAQYAALVLGLGLMLIGVIVMVANAHVT